MQQAPDLGNAKVPPTMDAQNRAIATTTYHTSFIEAYAIVMRLSAALAFAGALMSLVFIKNSAVKNSKNAGD